MEDGPLLAAGHSRSTRAWQRDRLPVECFGEAEGTPIEPTAPLLHMVSGSLGRPVEDLSELAQRYGVPTGHPGLASEKIQQAVLM